MHRLRTPAALLILAALTTTTASCKRETPASAPAGTATEQKSAPTQLLVEFDRLKGRWLRPDGGYVIELQALLPENRITAAYYNPGPINVGEARIYRENGFTKLFIKLQDQNYPGSTYTLIYDTENDLLRGIYFQATYGQEFQVEFSRMPAE
jgi:hypothetical protein